MILVLKIFLLIVYLLHPGNTLVEGRTIMASAASAPKKSKPVVALKKVASKGISTTKQASKRVEKSPQTTKLTKKGSLGPQDIRTKAAFNAKMVKKYRMPHNVYMGLQIMNSSPREVLFKATTLHKILGHDNILKKPVQSVKFTRVCNNVGGSPHSFCNDAAFDNILTFTQNFTCLLYTSPSPRDS
eukprot:TRINITY_DN2961_c0_g1_i2.p1 TRINITY_DN2961_c0_g1~~TRINITY_DN2961_c0_g1_i2.p1  ORF type:complete len:186 (-),score=4.38 TRINITY_DN2961_c0_g1_i2:51-608(-)